MLSTVCTCHPFVLRGGKRRSASRWIWREPIAALSTHRPHSHGDSRAISRSSILFAHLAPSTLPPASRPPSWSCKLVQWRCRVPVGQLARPPASEPAGVAAARARVRGARRGWRQHQANHGRRRRAELCRPDGRRRRL
jgi:hypothetical protein